MKTKQIVTVTVVLFVLALASVSFARTPSTPAMSDHHDGGHVDLASHDGGHVGPANHDH